MDIKIIGNNFDHNTFNKMSIHPLQSWEWGQARKEMGIEVLRITDNKNIYQITFHKIPYTKYIIGYMPRSVVPSRQVLKYLYEYGKNHSVVFIKMEPYQIKTDNSLGLSDNDIETEYSIRPSPHPLFPNWSISLDMQPSEEDLLKNMKPKTRYNIKLAQKKGVKVKEESNDTGFATFSKLYFETCRRQKYHGHTPDYHKIIWNNLKDSIAHILIAYYENTPLAVYELFYFNKKFYYPYGGTSIQHRNVMAANLLMWEAIRLGKKLGADTFDMWGTLPPNYPDKHPWAGFTKFKEGYGGSFKEYIGSYDLIINPAQYSLYNVLHKARTTLLSMF